jgi:pseudomonalisin
MERRLPDSARDTCLTPRWRRRPPVLTLLAGVLTALASASAAAALGSPATAPGGGPAAGLRGDDRVTLPGHVHPLARAESDVGPADPDLAMRRIVLVLRRRPGAEGELRRLLEAQQDPASPSYHAWLTPEEFGRRFGLASEQVGAVADWIRSEGFSVDGVARGRGWIEFSGTVRQVERTFHTAIRRFRVDGTTHHANSLEPSIPRALASSVAGIASLHDFVHTPLARVWKQVTPADQISGQNVLGPGDFATIYNVNPLYAAGLKGAGVKIAIPGRSDLVLADVQAFRSYFGLPANDPVIVHNGPPPGDLGGGEEVEADLDVQWSGAVAPQATIEFVVSATAFPNDGFTLSAAYIVDNALAPILSASFADCELIDAASTLDYFNALWGQAAAEGITVLVASGDVGAPQCYGMASVSGLCSTPYNVCVGGTMFVDTPAATWWSPNPDPVTKASALSYIPEATWNEPGFGATGGGASAVYPKPWWQVAPGVPDDGHRDLPDVSLAAAGHDGHVVFIGNTPYVVGGTSASAPCFAGLLALIVQKTGSPQGNANPTLYRLGNDQYANGGAAVFHDITSGDNTFLGVTGFASGTGYDLATGLGSVDASALAAAWTTQAHPDFALSLDYADVDMQPGDSFSRTVRLESFGGFQSPVALSVAGLPPGFTATFTPPVLSGAGSSTLLIASTARAASGWIPLDLVGAGGGISHSLPIYVLLFLDLVTNVHYLPQPQDGFVTDLTNGPDGAVWCTIVGLNGAIDRIGRITMNGALTEFPMNGCTWYQCYPNLITSGPDGALWFTEANGYKVGRSTTSGAISTFSPPAAPNNVLGGIVSGPDGALWFVEIGQAPRVGRVTPGGAFSVFPLPASDLLPPGYSLFPSIVAGPDGALWFTLYTSNKIGRITPAGAITEFSVPTPGSGPGAIVAGPDGALWFGEAQLGKIGRITTAGAIDELPTGMPYFPGVGGGILDLIVGPDGNLWFIADLAKGGFARSMLGRMTLAGRLSWWEFALEVNLQTGPDGNLWFIEAFSGRIGRVPFPTPPTDFYTVAPCRVLDTRLPSGPLGGPALAAGEVRDLPLAGNCGIPADAEAVVANLTVVNPSAQGYFDLSVTGSFGHTSTLNFRAGQTRANNAVVPLFGNGHTKAHLAMATGQADLVVDVTGYFR